MAGKYRKPGLVTFAAIFAFTGGYILLRGSHAATPSITVDFGNRANTTHPIPADFLGVGGLGMQNVISAAGPYLPQAGFKLTRMGDYIAGIFANANASNFSNAANQDWSKLDTDLTAVQQNNLEPIVLMSYIPTWLEPSADPCVAQGIDPTHTEPSYMVNGQDQGPHIWGQLTSVIVAHIDKNFPSLHPLYEIWNEPNGNGYMCVPSSDPTVQQQQRLAAWKALFAAAAPLMKQQAQKDGVTIRVGGPAHSYPMQNQLTTWFPDLLSDPTVYPYIDFISYHRYTDGDGMYGAANSMVSNAQDPAMGIAAEYEHLAQIVHAGKQPNAAQTPIYIDEYNSNPCHSTSSCRNDPSYAPVTNALYLVDFLNSVNDTSSNFGAASSVPEGLSYFTWNIPNTTGQGFCMFGVLDTALDCSHKNGTIVPYPQYYTYQLIGGPDYLHMVDGNSYVANSATTDLTGVFATGFYSGGQDSIVLVNSTATAYANVSVTAQNPGPVNSSANEYLLNSANPHILTTSSSLTTNGSGYSATVDLPAYSVVALKLAASTATVAGDCNGNGHVNLVDLSILLNHYGTNYRACDFNTDGIVNIIDLSTLISNFGT